MVNNSHGKRMVREDQIKKIGENASEIKKKVTSYKVDNITSISGEILSKMKAGDIVLKKTGEQYHAYIVSFKKNDEGICLTYTDASVVETVSYDLINGTWTYNSTDKTEIEGVKKVEANPTLAGTEAPLTGLQIGNTKYSVPQGGGTSLIPHKIQITFDGTVSGVDYFILLHFLIYSSSTQNLSFSDIADYIEYICPAYSMEDSTNDKYYNVESLDVSSNNLIIYYVDNGTEKNISVPISSLELLDTH